MTKQPTHVAVLGATGYVGAQLLAILAHHPQVKITCATTVRYAGKTVGDIFPALAPIADLPLTQLDTDRLIAEADLVLSALPHGASAGILGELSAAGLKVIDLSADFRFSDAAAYTAAYHRPHPWPELTARAVYGLAEFNAAAVAQADIIGVPGCYPTATLLALLPALKAGLIDPAAGAIVDAKSGISGAGREAKTANLFCEVSGGIRAYNVGGHRHQPEMAFQANAIGGAPLSVFFTPQVVPMERGILSSVYLTLAAGVSIGQVHQAYQDCYAHAPFAQVLPQGQFPTTKQVAGTNRFAIGIAGDEASGKLAVLCVIDNLIKGAAGQAVQCMNLMLGIDETTALPTMGGVI